MTLLPWKRTVNQTGSAGFADLALPLLPSLYNVAFRLSRNAADAEDVVQETCPKALRGFSTFEPGTNFKAWIFRILRNTYLTSRSGPAAMRTVPLEDEVDLEGAIDRKTPKMNLLRLSDCAALQAAMEKLSLIKRAQS